MTASCSDVFEALGVPLLQVRGLEDGHVDVAVLEHVALEVLAEYFWNFSIGQCVSAGPRPW
jgi:hypothetical protein